MADYGKIAKYWDVIQQERVDYKIEAKRIVEMFEGKNINRVLDIACGTGSHLIELTKLGHKCTGIDLSPEMIDVAHKKVGQLQLAIDFHQGDLRKLDIKEKFDAVIGLYVMTSIVNDEEFKSALWAVARVLRDKGLFIFNVLNAKFKSPMPPMPGAPPAIFFMDVAKETEDVKIVRLNSVQLQGNIQDWTAIYLIEENGQLSLEISKDKLRLFNLDEVKRLLQECGFQFRSVEPVDVQVFKNRDLHICAQLRRAAK